MADGMARGGAHIRDRVLAVVAVCGTVFGLHASMDPAAAQENPVTARATNAPAAPAKRVSPSLARSMAPHGPVAAPDPHPSVTVRGRGIPARYIPPPPPPPPPAPAPPPRPDCAVLACVALTFDDGPSPATTPVLLDHLERAGAKASFFVIGAQAARWPDIVRRQAASGMEVENHTHGHADLARVGPARAGAQVQATQQIVAGITGRAPAYLRPPFGSHDASTSTLGLPVVLWDVDPQDWKDRDTRVVIDRVVGATRAGSIILLHDVHSSTVDAVPEIIAALRARGFTLVTLTDLLGARPAGSVSSRR